MKKFFAAVCCCALVAMNVSAQEPVVVAQESAALSIIEAPDSETTPVSAQDGAAAVEAAATAEAPVIVQDAAPAMEAAPQSIVTEGYATEAFGSPAIATEGYAMPTTDMGAAPYADQGYAVAPVASGCGCGAAAPAMNYATAATYAPAVSSGCSTCAQPAAASSCCESGRSRPQVISRFRGRMTSIGGRRNSGCCN